MRTEALDVKRLDARTGVSLLLASSLVALAAVAFGPTSSTALGATPLMRPGEATCNYDEAGKLTSIGVQPPQARRYNPSIRSWGLWQATLQQRAADGTWKFVARTGFDDPLVPLRRVLTRLKPFQRFSSSIPAEGFVRVSVTVRWIKANSRAWGKRTALTRVYNNSATRNAGCIVQREGSEPPPPQGDTPLWWGNADRAALNTNSTLVDTERGLEPVVGDFDGDGKEDILWYSAAGAETFWWGAGRTFEVTDSGVLAPAGYQPLAGDFDGDNVDDIYWFRNGPDNDFQWWGSTTRAFEVRNNSDAGGTYDQVVAGNFNGDAFDDIFFYRHPDKTKQCEYTGNQFYWWGKAGRGDLATGSTTEVIGCYYKFFIGDVDGDGKDDQLRYGLRPNPRDFLTFMGANPQDVAFQQAYDFRPVMGDFDGDTRADIFWFHATAADSQWWGPAARSEFLGSFKTAHNIDGDYYPVSGDFDGDGKDDILWYFK